MMLEGKTALVTGGTGGIGSAICERFENEGAQVIAADLTDNGGAGTFRPFDVTNEAQIIETFDDLSNSWGKLDILVNAAGI